MIPNLNVFRPADGKETALAWGMAHRPHRRVRRPCCCRDRLFPPVDRKVSGDLADMKRGAYLVTGGERPDAIVAATGSELELALAAREVLAGEGKKINVVSIPCLESVRGAGLGLPAASLPARQCPVATVEAGLTGPWRGHRGAGRADDRHRHLRRIGTGQRQRREIRLHPGSRDHEDPRLVRASGVTTCAICGRLGPA